MQLQLFSQFPDQGLQAHFLLSQSLNVLISLNQRNGEGLDNLFCFPHHSLKAVLTILGRPESRGQSATSGIPIAIGKGVLLIIGQCYSSTARALCIHGGLIAPGECFPPKTSRSERSRLSRDWRLRGQRQCMDWNRGTSSSRSCLFGSFLTGQQRLHLPGQGTLSTIRDQSSSMVSVLDERFNQRQLLPLSTNDVVIVQCLNLPMGTILLQRIVLSLGNTQLGLFQIAGWKSQGCRESGVASMQLQESSRTRIQLSP